MKLRKHLSLFLFVFCLGTVFTANSAFGSSYFGYSQFGGGWSDAEKSKNNTDDDNMCWSAAASNILSWTGWGNAYATGAAQTIFYNFQTNWSDEGSLPEFAWDWWFSGNNGSQGWSGWSQVEVPGSGAYHPTENFWSYFHDDDDLIFSDNFDTVRDFLHAGYGTTLAIRGTGDHAITVWGYEYHMNDAGEYIYDGIWLTDSDDHQNWTEYDPNGLKYTGLILTDDKWYLQNYGTGGWYIGEVYALDRMPAGAVPLPPGILLLASGLAGLAGCKRKFRKA